jgi:hypothetical protein
VTYVIESVCNQDGTPHERDGRRKGHRVEIIRCTIGAPLTYRYLDEENARVRTSAVDNVLIGEGLLVVWTRNTVYTFTKEAAQPDAEKTD